MSAMRHLDDRYLRLGLLLAGGGARVRRQVAALEAGRDLETTLSEAGVPRAVLRAARDLASSEAQRVHEKIVGAGWRWLIPGDEDFPKLLADITDPPFGLFLRGRIAKAKTVAVVGSRKATPYGRQVARLLGEELGRAGVVLVSGMARGVDEAAHRGALDAGGPSWAVWVTGPDSVYPREHEALAEELAATGALMTEYPPGTPPRPHHFPERNRILAGLSEAVVVVEAAARSGALITARLAIEEGREVMAVPGNIFSQLSVGPNTLIRVGARPLLTPRDLFDAIGHEPPEPSPPDNIDGLLRFIEPGEALTADEIALRAQVEIAAVVGDLLDLELAGHLRREADGRYTRVRGAPPREP
jgi:DNA processing protein